MAQFLVFLQGKKLESLPLYVKLYMCKALHIAGSLSLYVKLYMCKALKFKCM